MRHHVSIFFAHVFCLRTPHVFTDSEGRIFVILAGRPTDPDWDEVMEGVVKALTNARKQGFAKGVFNRENVNHRRGLFAVLGDGVSFGGGQRVSLNRNV
jgi:hypothetical protein